MEAGQFRADLYYRLNSLHLRLPPLRSRGDDWALILDDCLDQGSYKAGRRKRFSADALALLRRYDWPANVRDVEALAQTAYDVSEGVLFERRDVLQFLDEATRTPQHPEIPSRDRINQAYERLLRGEGSFWEVVYQPYMDRDLARADVRALVARGLTAARGSYKTLRIVFGVAEDDYERFMDFLRHHRLKPD